MNRKHETATFGRDEVIDLIWRTLDKRSVYMNDLRRIGKTMILEAMRENPAPGWTVIKRDLGRCHSVEEFAALVYQDVMASITGKTKLMRRMTELIGKAGGAQIGPVKLPDGRVAPWKEVLERTFADLDQASAEEDLRVVFLWDEVPFLLDNVIKNSAQGTGERMTMQVLDTIRSLGQDYPRVKMVLTGSIGLHHILSDLREENYVNSPLNHMKPIAPGPLKASDAVTFASHLLKERGVGSDEGCAAEIARLVGHVPYYIESFIDDLRYGEKLMCVEIEEKLTQRLTDPDDDWDLPHYRTRLRRYFGKEETIVLAILDHLARSSNAQSNAEIMAAMKSIGVDIEEELARHLLKLLHRDHYIEKDAAGKWRFRLALVQRWWKLDRGLS